MVKERGDVPWSVRRFGVPSKRRNPAALVFGEWFP